MGNTYKRIHLVSLLAIIFLFSCGSKGNFTLKMTDKAIDDKLGKVVEQVNITLNEIVVKKKDGDDVTVVKDAQKINLMDLLDGKTTTLGEISLEIGEYNEIRVVVAEGNTIKFEGDETLYSLKIPSGTSSGIKIKTSFNVEKDKDFELILDFDAAESVTELGKDKGMYSLRPVIKVKK